MKLSIVIINWNDMKVLPGCIKSIFNETSQIAFEVIVSDNGSVYDMIEYIRKNYSKVIIVENKADLGFARGNNMGIAAAKGEYVLILNPDTIVHDHALEKLVRFADSHPDAAAFGCRVLNADGSFQNSARPFPSIWRYWIAALYLRPLAFISPRFHSDTYTGWHGTREREIDWQSGCCVMFRGDILKRMGCFDPRFFYHYEEVDLCYRIREAGYKILYTPRAEITHLGGQSVGRFPVRFVIEALRNRYKYFYKHYGIRGAKRCKTVTQAHLMARRVGYGVVSMLDRSESMKRRMRMYRIAIEWNTKLHVERFIRLGEEPCVGLELAKADTLQKGNV